MMTTPATLPTPSLLPPFPVIPPIPICRNHLNPLETAESDQGASLDGFQSDMIEEENIFKGKGHFFALQKPRSNSIPNFQTSNRFANFFQNQPSQTPEKWLIFILNEWKNDNLKQFRVEPHTNLQKTWITWLECYHNNIWEGKFLFPEIWSRIFWNWDLWCI